MSQGRSLAVMDGACGKWFKTYEFIYWCDKRRNHKGACDD